MAGLDETHGVLPGDDSVPHGVDVMTKRDRVVFESGSTRARCLVAIETKTIDDNGPKFRVDLRGRAMNGSGNGGDAREGTGSGGVAA